MAKGLVVPDDPSPSLDTWKIVLLRVPNDPQWLGIVTGLLFSPCNGYWWKKNSGDWELARDTMCQIAMEFNKMELCEAILQCIETNEGVRDGIRDVPPNPVGGQQDIDRPMGVGVTGIDSCNPDSLFGATTFLVDYMLTNISDALEIIEVSTNALELSADWLDNIPVIGGLLAAFPEYISWIQDTVFENFEANVTIGLVDTYRCDLFCLWRDSSDCSLTPRDVFDYFFGRIGDPSLLDNTIDLFTYLIGGVWSGSQYVDVMMASAIGMMILDDAIPFLTIPTIYSYDTAIRLGANDANPDWSILCDCPPPTWEAFIDFELTSGGFVASNGWQSGLSRGNYVTSDGWNTVGGVFFSGYASYANPRLDFSIETLITKVEMTYNCTVVGVFSPNVESAIISRPTAVAASGVNLTTFTTQTTGIGDQTRMTGVGATASWGIAPSLWNNHRSGNMTPSANGTARIRSVRIFGEGVIPTELLAYII